jgi:uncharacterized protein (DUF2141 family)
MALGRTNGLSKEIEMKDRASFGAGGLFAACALFGLMRSAAAADLIVTVDGLRNAKGTVRLAVDNSVSSWGDKTPPYASAGVKSAVGSVVYTFKDVPAGAYAVAVYQDENDNDKFDMSFLGLPKEPYGFSNNPNLMRKPTFQEAHVDVAGTDVSIVIHLLRLPLSSRASRRLIAAR